MEFSMELELVCTGIGNELRFKLIRGHTPKLCLINLIPWLVVVQLGELGRCVPLGQALMLCQDVSVVHSIPVWLRRWLCPWLWGVGASRVSQGCFQGEVLLFQLWLSTPEHSKGGGGFYICSS